MLHMQGPLATGRILYVACYVDILRNVQSVTFQAPCTLLHLTECDTVQIMCTPVSCNIMYHTDP